MVGCCLRRFSTLGPCRASTMMAVAVHAAVATIRLHGYDVILFCRVLDNDFQRIFGKRCWNLQGYWRFATQTTPKDPAELGLDHPQVFAPPAQTSLRRTDAPCPITRAVSRRRAARRIAHRRSSSRARHDGRSGIPCPAAAPDDS